MASRLLSFLSDVEHSLHRAAARDQAGWEVSRMVNYHHGLARMTLSPAPGSDAEQLHGAIFVQAYTLADGSTCLKASLNWDGYETYPMLAVYSKPQTDWADEAAGIADAWLRGPPTRSTTVAEAPLESLDRAPREAAPLAVAMA